MDILSDIHTSKQASLKKSLHTEDIAPQTAVTLLRRLIAPSCDQAHTPSEDTPSQKHPATIVTALIPLLNSDKSIIRNTALSILRDVAEEDIPALQQAFEGSNTATRIAIIDILGYAKAPKSIFFLGKVLLNDPDSDVRHQAAVSLGRLNYPQSVDALIKALDDDEWVRFAVVESLSKIQAGNAVEQLAHSLENCSAPMASVTVEALGAQGKLKAIPFLLKFMKKTSPPLCARSIQALLRIAGDHFADHLSGEEQEDLSSTLLHMLDYSDTVEAQENALLVLGSMGTPENCMAVLGFACKSLKQNKSRIFKSALCTLVRMGVNESIREALNSEEPLMADIALRTLTIMSTPEALELLREELPSLPEHLQSLVYDTFARCANDKELPFFQGILEKSQNAEQIKIALNFFSHSESNVDEEKIFSFLHVSRQEVREAALIACINQKPPQMHERFIRLFQTAKAPLQKMMAVYALGHFKEKESYIHLLNTLQDTDQHVQRITLETLTAMHYSFSREHLPFFIPCLEADSPCVRIATIVLLREKKAHYAAPYLIPLLCDEDPRVCAKAIEAIGKFGYKKAIPTLMSHFDASRPMQSFAIIEALGNIGGKGASKALCTLQKHKDTEIREAAHEAYAHHKQVTAKSSEDHSIRGQQ